MSCHIKWYRNKSPGKKGCEKTVDTTDSLSVRTKRAIFLLRGDEEDEGLERVFNLMKNKVVAEELVGLGIGG